MCERLGYLEFMSLVRGVAAAITDSARGAGGDDIPAGAVPDLRPVTERPVAVTSGINRLLRANGLASAGARQEAAFRYLIRYSHPSCQAKSF
jgi:UDP-N-acetylglucosamine 2-epimerase (non-hydrolysing)